MGIKCESGADMQSSPSGRNWGVGKTEIMVQEGTYQQRSLAEAAASMKRGEGSD
jgi:hypothetical protein